MKTTVKYLCSFILLSAFAITPVSPRGLLLRDDDQEGYKTYRWTYEINPGGEVIYRNYDCDMVIHTWDKDQVEMVLKVEMKTRTAEDDEYFDNYLKDFVFESSPSRVELKGKFWKNRINIMGRKTIDLEEGRTLRYSKFRMKGELWVPASCKFTLESKYSRIDMEGLNGSVTLDLYNDKLYGGDIGGATNLQAKYCRIELGDIGDLTFDFYDTDLYCRNAGEIKGVAKYSLIDAGDVKDVNIDSYSDKARFNSTGNVIFKAKYSDFTSVKSGSFSADCYECNVHADEIMEVAAISKYTNFSFGKAAVYINKSSYEGKFSASIIKDIRMAESKYGDYKIGELLGSVQLEEGYEDNITISRTGEWFSGIAVDGKYLDLSLGIPPELDYRIKAQLKYAHFDINEESLTTRIKIVDGSDFTFEGFRGKENDKAPLLNLKGYEISLKILDI